MERHDAFGTVGEIKVDAGAFLEAFVTVHLNCREVGKSVGAAIVGLDEAVSLGIIEPFDRTAGHGCLHCVLPLSVIVCR